MLISAGDIVRKTALLYKKEYKYILYYVAFMVVPTLVIGLSNLGFQYMERSGFATETASNSMYIGVAIVFSIINLWISIAFIRAVAKLLKGQTVKKPWDEMKDAEHAIVPMILTSILTALAALGGFILIIIPGIIFIVWFSFASQAVALDNKRPVDALKSSKALVSGQWWAVAWRLVAPIVIFGIAVWAIRGIISFPISWISVTIGSDIISQILFGLMLVLNGVVGLLAVPFATIAPTLLYLELQKTPLTKIQKEA